MDLRDEVLILVDAQRRLLRVEHRQLGGLHDVGADITLDGFHEEEHLDVAEERQAEAEAAARGVAAEIRDGLEEAVVGDRDVQAGRQRPGGRQARQEVAGGELVDEIIAVGDERVVEQGRLAPRVVRQDVHAEVDADPLEEVLRDADEPHFDGDFLVLQATQGGEQILDLLLDVGRLIDDQSERHRVVIDRRLTSHVAPRLRADRPGDELDELLLLGVGRKRLGRTHGAAVAEAVRVAQTRTRAARRGSRADRRAVGQGVLPGVGRRAEEGIGRPRLSRPRPSRRGVVGRDDQVGDRVGDALLLALSVLLGGDLQDIVLDDVGQLDLMQDQVEGRLHRDALQLHRDRAFHRHARLVEGRLVRHDVDAVHVAQFLEDRLQRRVLEADVDRRQHRTLDRLLVLRRPALLDAR